MASESFKKLKSSCLDLVGAVYPDRCVCCGEIAARGEELCSICRSSLEFINRDKRCAVCGLEKDSCVCKKRVYHFERLVSVFKYEGITKRAMRKYKLLKKQSYSQFFIKQMSLLFLNEYSDIKFDAVCSVPTSRRSYFKRGFDHSAVLRDGIARNIGLPVLKDALGCKSFVRSQHGSDSRSRLNNIRGKYFIKKPLSGGTFLLVDDIKTTGATLDECARQLLIAGADRVYAITALATVYKRNKTRDLKKGKI